jgi:Tryptophan-associated transmembrane protein (Trp_oprn_chp)
MRQRERRAAPTAAIVTIVGGVLLAVASFLPWAKVSGSGASVTAKGLDGSDGYITLAAGLIAVVAGLVLLRATRRVLAVVAVLVGLVGGGIALYDALTAKDSVLDAAAEELAPSFGVSADQVRAALDQAVDSGTLGVSIGVGLYIAIAGGLVAIAGGVLGLRETVAEPAAAPTAPTPPTPATPSAPAQDPRESPASPPPPDASGP